MLATVALWCAARHAKYNGIGLSVCDGGHPRVDKERRSCRQEGNVYVLEERVHKLDNIAASCWMVAIAYSCNYPMAPSIGLGVPAK